MPRTVRTKREEKKIRASKFRATKLDTSTGTRPSNRNIHYSNTDSNTPKSEDSVVEFLLLQSPDCRLDLVESELNFWCSVRPQQVPSTEFALKILVSAPTVCAHDALRYVLRHSVAGVAISTIVTDRPIHSPFWQSSLIGRCTFAGRGRHKSKTLRTKMTVKYNTSWTVTVTLCDAKKCAVVPNDSQVPFEQSLWH